MKKRVLFTTIILIQFIFSLNAQIPTEGLVAYYPFNGNVNDESGNGYHATNNSAVLATDRFGNENQAYYFNGSNSYIHLPTPNVGQDDGLGSWACWFRVPDGFAPEHAQLLDIFHAGGFHLSYGKAGGGMEIGFGDRKFVNDTQLVNDDQWHFVVLSYDNLNLRLHVDGELRDMVTDGEGQIDYNGVLGIYLGMGGFYVNYLTGIIDDVRIYNRALSSNEILELYNEENPSLLNYSVTLNVDMTEADEFNPETDDVYIAGGFAGWPEPGTDPGLMMEPTEENPLIYTLTIDSIPTGNIQYKYFRVINNVPSWEYGEWGGDPNREIYIYENMIINDIWAIILPPVEEMIADFESGAGNLDIIAVIGSGAWNNYPIDETFMTIDNPNPNGINTSSTVMKFLRRGLNDGGEPHAGFVANETLNVSDYGFLHVMVWKPKISPLKITTHDDFQYTYDAFNKNPQQHTHTWVDVVFDLRGFENELWLFDFMPDYEEPLTSNELVEIYFDNLRLSNDSVPYTISINNFMANETSICENASVNFIPDTLSVNYDSVLWSFPGGIPASSSELFPTVEYAIAGNFDVTLTAWHNGLFNVIHKTGYIDVIPVPEIPAMPAGPEIICFSEFATEYYTNSEMAIWELLPDEAGNINYYDSACQIIWDQNFSGEVSLKVKIYNGCGEGEYSDPLYIQKLPSSNPDFSASQTLFVNQPYTVQFANLTPNQENFDFFWDFGNGDTSTETQPEYTYPENGEYPITLAATNKTTLCTDTLMKENYIFCSGTGIANNHFNGFKYYVDVTDRSLCLAFENPPDNFTFRLCSLNGTINRILVLTQKATIIPFNELTPGVYLFVINTNDKQITRKILIK